MLVLIIVLLYYFVIPCHLKKIFIIAFSLKNLDYVIVSGARRQERRWDPTENEQVVPEDKGVSSRATVIVDERLHCM